MTASEMRLRAATQEDSDFAFHVWKASMRQYVEATWGWDETWQRQRQQAEFAEFFDSHYQIVEAAGQQVGTLIVHRRPDYIYLSGLYLLPQYQRQGIGTQIMRGLLTEAEVEKIPIRLRVLKVNSQARRLYESLGFIAIDENEPAFTVMEAARQVDAVPPKRV